MNANRQRFFNYTTTHRAKLACLSGVNLWSATTSIFDFIAQKFQKLTPTGIANAFAYVGTGKAADVKFLDKDNAILIDQLAAEFMMKVKPLVCYLFVKVTDLLAQLAILATTPLAAGLYLLELGEFRFTNSKPAGIVYQFAGRQGRKVFKAHVNPNATGWRGQWLNIRQLNLEGSIPVAQVVTLDNDHLDCGIFRQGAMLKHSQIAHTLNVQSAIYKSKPVIILVADRLKPTFALVARIARLFSTLDPAKESVKSFVKLTQGLLNRSVINKGGVLIKSANRPKLSILVNKTNALTIHLPRQTPFGQGIVVQAPMNFKDAVKRLALFSIRVKTEFVREVHYTFIQTCSRSWRSREDFVIL